MLTCEQALELISAQLDGALTAEEAGALDEARAALARCPDTTAPGWTGIGCAETAAYLSGALSLDQCVELWTRNTRAYAKRQWTWVRADKRILWFRPSQNEDLTPVVKYFLNI